MQRHLVWLAAVVCLICSSCAHQPKPSASATIESPTDVAPSPLTSADDAAVRAGPTLMDRVAGGYELRNHRVRAVISDATGDVTYWGAPDGKRNLLLGKGVVAGLSSAAGPTTVEGYVEKRDDQTWQFIGDDAAHKIGWRKIYCLDGTSLLVTFLVQNKSTVPITGRMQASAEFASARVIEHTPDLFDAESAFGAVHVRAFNEHHESSASPALPIIVVGDEQVWKPGDRQSLTTEWRLETQNSEFRTQN